MTSSVWGVRLQMATTENPNFAISKDCRLYVMKRGSRGRDTILSLTWETGLGPPDP
jgi:hypothetical protein